jgi:hypothetical protein
MERHQRLRLAAETSMQTKTKRRRLQQTKACRQTERIPRQTSKRVDLDRVVKTPSMIPVPATGLTVVEKRKESFFGRHLTLGMVIVVVDVVVVDVVVVVVVVQD